MTKEELIQKNIPTDLQEIVKQYTINDIFFESKPDLIVLILKSKSMDTKEEKQSWFNLLPIMGEDQIAKLYDILNREKQKLEEIEKKYEDKKDNIINKFVQKFDESAYQNKIIQLKEKEAVHEQKEDQEADALLNNL
jgi:hypothetical protein